MASRSPRRSALLSLITEDFSILPSSFDEKSVVEADPFLLVRILSLSKASTVSADSEDVVIGCDTVVYLDGEILGIPQNREDACRMLSLLSGKTHSVISGVCVLENNRIHQFECETLVTFYPISEEELSRYLDTKEPYNKAGGYGIQGAGGLFVKKIDGDYTNVVGLPLSRLNRLLREL